MKNYIRSNGKFATVLPNSVDIQSLEDLGIYRLAIISHFDVKVQRMIQRLVDGNYLAEGSY